MVTLFLALLNFKIKTKQKNFCVSINAQVLPIIKKLLELNIILTIKNITKNKILIELNLFILKKNSIKLKMFQKISMKQAKKFNEIKTLLRKNLIFIFYTSKGILNSNECLKLKIGGIPLLCIKF